MKRTRVALFNDTSNEKHIGCSEVIGSITNLCRKNGMKVVQRLTRAEINSQNSKVVQQRLSDIDLIIVNGEGTLHRGSLFLENVFGCLPKGKKAVLMNTVWDKMYFDDVKRLNVFDFITVREGMSFHALKRIYDEKRIMLVPDIIFSIDTDYSAIGYGDSVLSSLKKDLANKRNFFPMQENGAQTPDVYSYLSWLKTLELYVTGRFHGVCLAILSEIPFLAFPSNSHKIEGILSDFGCTDLLIASFDEIEEKKALAKEKISLMKEYKELAKKKIEQFVERLKTLSSSVNVTENGEEDEDEQ